MKDEGWRRKDESLSLCFVLGLTICLENEGQSSFHPSAFILHPCSNGMFVAATDLHHRTDLTELRPV